MLWLFLQRRTDLFDLSPKRMLHVAPEPALAWRFKCVANLDYLSADLDARTAMVKMDICEIHCPDNTFDVICCSHVLEHVPDDRRAMREFWRVLKSQGWAVILVPITAPKTFEDTSVTGPRERERLFGQYDHVRRYGPDFEERLEAAGFKVTRTMTEDLVTDPDEAHYLGVSANETIFLCEK